MSNQDIYALVTSRILAKLEAGTIPWQRPWSSTSQNGIPLPMNYQSKKEYRGINIWLTWSAGYECPYWLGFSQMPKGAHVRKGEKGTPIIYAKQMERTTSTPEGEKVERFPLLRYSHVWNLEQLNGIEIPTIEKPPEFQPISACMGLLSATSVKPLLQHGGNRACYSPSRDLLTMPEKERFNIPENYYATFYHELVHATGHETRLNRPEIQNIQPFGSPDYSREELVAEMGAAMLCAITGIENMTIENQTAYLAGWLKAFQSDTKMLLSAASAAQKAADLILGKQKKKGES